MPLAGTTGGAGSAGSALPSSHACSSSSWIGESALSEPDYDARTAAIRAAGNMSGESQTTVGVLNLSCPILDPFGNAVHTAQQFDLLGEDVLVTGAGPIGMMAAAVARHAGARTVVLTDINDFRLELAQKVAPGVRTVNTTKEDIHDVMKELGLKVGFDVALEMSGSPIAFKQCVDTLIMGGGMALLGIPGKPMETDWGAIILKALTIKGVYGREMFTTWRKMLGLLKAGLDLTPLITHRLGIDDFETGFSAMRSGEAGKVVLDWGK